MLNNDRFDQLSFSKDTPAMEYCAAMKLGDLEERDYKKNGRI